jgi:hypothetical protein
VFILEYNAFLSGGTFPLKVFFLNEVSKILFGGNAATCTKALYYFTVTSLHEQDDFLMPFLSDPFL